MDGMIELTASDGFKLSAYRSEARGKARGGLIVVQEIFGVNAHIKSVCDGYAADGYLAIAPALFDRAQRGVDLGYSPEDIAQGRAIRGKVSNETALLDIAAAREIAAEAGKVGIVGYCWGGLITWLSAARVSPLACAVAYYGGGMPEAIGETPRCPVMAHFGEWDKIIPVAEVDNLKAAHPESRCSSTLPITVSTAISVARTMRSRPSWRVRGRWSSCATTWAETNAAPAALSRQVQCRVTVIVPLIRPVADQRQKLLTRRERLAECAEHRRCDHHRILLLHAAHHHAQMARFDHHAHALRVDRIHDCLRDLLGQPLLQLQPARVHVDQTRELADAEDRAARDVADVAAAEERQHVVLAQAVELDVLHDHHAVGSCVKTAPLMSFPVSVR